MSNEQRTMNKSYPKITINSEEVLKRDREKPEEEAWAHLQQIDE